MGALRGVYQLKSTAIYGAAFLRVRDDQKQAFSEKYLLETDRGKNEYYLFENVVAQVSEDGKVLKFGMYQEDRILDLEKPGIYLLIQSMNKRGFYSDFVEKMHEWAPFLEDQLFFVTYDTGEDWILCFEIKNGQLNFRESDELKNWNYNAEDYLEALYAEDEQLLADFFTDRTIDFKVFLEDMLLHGGALDDYYELDDYEELLQKLERYAAKSSNESTAAMMEWLNDKMEEYRSLEERKKDTDNRTAE